MENKYLETGTIFRAGPHTNGRGDNLTWAVRKAVADHKRLLQGPYGPMAGQRITRLQDGTVIITWINPYGLVPTIVARVIVPGSQPKDEIFELVMESGLIIPPSAAELLLDATTPGLLIPLDSQKSLYAEAEDQLLDVYTGKRTFSFRNYSSSSLESLSLSPAASDNSKKAFVEMEGWTIPGKLGLLAKAQLIGAKDVNYTNIADFLHGQRYTGLEISEQNPKNSYWLYTISLGEYVLLWISNTTLYARMVVPQSNDSGAVDSIIADIADAGLAQTDVTYRRYEAYILSTCVFQGDWITVADYDIVGEAVAYGWKPTWNGTKAAIVLHEASPPTLYGQPPLKARKYTFTISSNPSYDSSQAISTENLPISVDLDETAPVEWTMDFPRDCIWHPSHDDRSKVTPWFPKECSEDWLDEPDVADIPVYCWYDDTNRLVTATYSRTTGAPLTNAYSNSFAAWSASWGKWYGNIGTFEPGYLEWSTDYLDSNFKLVKGSIEEEGAPAIPVVYDTDESATLSGVSMTYHAYYYFYWRGDDPTYCTNYTPPYGYPSQCLYHNQPIVSDPSMPEWVPWTVSDSSVTLCYSGRECRIVPMNQYQLSQLHYRAGGTSTSKMLVITSSNAEAAFLVSLKTDSYDGYNQDFESDLPKVDEDTILGDRNYAGMSYLNLHTGGGAGCLGQYPKQEASTYAATVQEVTYTVECYYWDKFEQVQLPTLIATGDETTVIPNGLSDIFSVSHCDPDGAPVLEVPFYTLASVEGLKFYLTKLGGTAEYEFGPNFETYTDSSSLKLFAGWQ